MGLNVGQQAGLAHEPRGRHSYALPREDRRKDALQGVSSPVEILSSRMAGEGKRVWHRAVFHVPIIRLLGSFLQTYWCIFFLISQNGHPSRVIG